MTDITAFPIPSTNIAALPDLGALTDSSSVVGERAGSGRFAATALRSYVLTGIISVKDFGAKGDNTTDDTAAFNAALAYVASLGGGKLRIPAGHYRINAALGYTAGFLHIQGDGPNTTIHWGSTTAMLLNFTGSDITLSDFRVVTPFQTSTAGVLFNFVNANNAKLTRLWTDGGYGIVQFLGAAGQFSYRTSITDCNFVNVMGNGVYYDQFFGGLGTISGLEMLGAPTNTGNGIIVFAGDTFTWTNVNIQGFEFGVNVTSKTGGINYAGVIHAVNVLCDGGGNAGTQDGWYFDGSAAGSYVTRIRLSNCWAGVMGRDGFRVWNASDITLTNCIAVANSGQGIMVVSPSEDITLSGCTVVANSAGASNTNDGIHVVGPVTDFIITGCRCRPNAAFPTNSQRYGIFVDGAANNRYIISNNDVHGNATGGLLDSGTGTSKFVSQNIV